MLPCFGAGKQFGEGLKLFQGLHREETAKLRSLALAKEMWLASQERASLTYALAEVGDSCEIRFDAPVAQLDSACASAHPALIRERRALCHGGIGQHEKGWRGKQQ
jgi:hypothetical protein